MSKRRGSNKIRNEALRTLAEAPNYPPLITLAAIDATILDDQGIGVHLGVRRDGQQLYERALETIKKEKSFRQTFLDMGHQLLGSAPVNLKQVIPRLVEPACVNSGALVSFFDDIKARMREGLVLVYGGLGNLVELESCLCPGNGPAPEGFYVIGGVMPGRYGLLVPRSEVLRKALGTDPEEFAKIIAIDLGGEGDRMRALDRGKDTEENEERLDEAMDHLNDHLEVSTTQLREMFSTRPYEVDEEEDA